MILAIDPGKVTGVATYDPDSDEFWSSEIAGGLEGFAQWYTYFPMDGLVVIEKYTIGAMKTKIREDYNAVYINGFVLGTGVVWGIDVRQQSVSNVKSFSTNAKLRKLGWFKGGAGHADDASRHLLAFLSRRPEGQPIMERLLEA